MLHMAYVKRDWDNTSNEVLKDDFKRIENGIEANDLEIAKQKNPTIPDTLAYDLINHTHEDLTNLVDRGYLNSKTIAADYDIDTLTENGFYSWVYGEGNKKPDGIGAYYIKVQKITDNYVLQELTKSWGKGKQWFRVNEDGTWSDWQQIVTTQTLDDRGYLNAKIVTSSIATEITSSGKYIISNNCTDKPPLAGSHIYTCDATFERVGYGTLILREYSTGSTIWVNDIKNGVLQTWQQLATNTKTPFSCTASTGYTILWQDCYILNGRKYINVRIKKSDDTLFEAKQHAIFTTPYGTLNRIPLTIMPYGDTKFNMMSSTFQNGVLWYGKQVYITPTSATAYGFEVKCEFDN